MFTVYDYSSSKKVELQKSYYDEKRGLTVFRGTITIPNGVKEGDYIVVRLKNEFGLIFFHPLGGIIGNYQYFYGEWAGNYLPAESKYVLFPQFRKTIWWLELQNEISMTIKIWKSAFNSNLYFILTSIISMICFGIAAAFAVSFIREVFISLITGVK